jgi:hypothetical protein
MMTSSSNAPARRPSAARSLIPREHGAYAQLVLPQLAVLLAAGPTLAAVLMSTGSALAFVSHESLMVATGGRGTRALREEGARARRTLLTYGLLGAVLGALGAYMLPGALRFTLALPLLLGAVAMVASSRLGPRALLAQLASSAAFACAVLPVGVAAGLSPLTCMIHACVWLLVFLVSTMMARTLAHREERGRRFLVALAALLVLLAAWTAVAWLPLGAVVALTPACLACVAVAVRPPPPARIRAVGWALVGTSTFAAAALALGVRAGVLHG